MYITGVMLSVVCVYAKLAIQKKPLVEEIDKPLCGSHFSTLEGKTTISRCFMSSLYGIFVGLDFVCFSESP